MSESTQGSKAGMHVVVDITHPAHVHFFKNAIARWKSEGHTVDVVAQRKDIATDLLEELGIAFTRIGSAGRGVLGLGKELVIRTSALWRFLQQRKPDVIVAIAGVYSAPAGFFSRVPAVAFSDTENATVSNQITFPFCSRFCVPECFEASVPARKEHRYKGYHELAYLHPNHFIPDAAVVEQLGVPSNRPFIVIRAVSWGALHDLGDHGFADLGEIVRMFAKTHTVVVTSESPLDDDLPCVHLTENLHLVHHLLAFADLFFGESATMASESAVLGTPAIFVSSSKRGYTNDLQRTYGLVHNFSGGAEEQQRAIDCARELLADEASKQQAAEARKRVLADHIDVTDYIVKTVLAVGAR